MTSFGIPNGSLYEPTLKLLDKVGISILTEGRKFRVEMRGFSNFTEALIMRPQDIPEAVTDGVLDAGICGWDCVMESHLEHNLVKVTELDYSKKSAGPVKVVIFGKAKKIIDSTDILVTSEYPNLTADYFKRATVRFSHGSTESKVAFGRYDYGVCVMETGQSIRDNKLNILVTMLVSPTVLIAREETAEMTSFGAMLTGALDADRYVLVKMNAERLKKETILNILPSRRSPTVNKCADGSFAIEAVVKRSELINVTFGLVSAGATDILTTDVLTILS